MASLVKDETGKVFYLIFRFLIFINLGSSSLLRSSDRLDAFYAGINVFITLDAYSNIFFYFNRSEETTRR